MAKPTPAFEALAYSVAEAAAALGISENTARTEIAAGRLPSLRVRRRLLVPKKALAGWVAQNTVRAARKP